MRTPRLPKAPRAPKPPPPPKPPYRPNFYGPKFPVLGADPSLTHTAGLLGTVATEINTFTVPFELRPLSKFSIQTEPHAFAHRMHRLKRMSGAFSDELYRVKGTGLLVVEAYAFGSTTGTGSYRYEWGGQIRLIAYERGWDILEVAPSMLKAFTTGKGNSKKDAMMLEVFKRWGYTPTDDNDADAFALAQFGAAFLRWTVGGQTSKDDAKRFQKLDVIEAIHAPCAT